VSAGPAVNRNPPLQLAVLISGRGSNMLAIAEACRRGMINAQVTLVIADRADARGLDSAAAQGLATRLVDRPPGCERAEFERRMLEAIDGARPGLVVLAGFMRVLSPEFVAHYAGRMINIHPSLLPLLRGLHTHQRALQEGATEHGASVHYVTAELDGGPVVLQARIKVRADDTEATLAARVLVTEHVIYPRVISWIADGKLIWRQGHLFLDGVPLQRPIVEDLAL
jgi:phosphoribosylglycinamide formyltransferase 1